MCDSPAMAACMAAHEVQALRELRQRAIDEGVQTMGALNELLNTMVAERSRFISQGRPDSACDAYEQATDYRKTLEQPHA